MLTYELPVWINDYIGLPFAEHGRGPDAYDCWGLVRDVLARQFDLAGLPDYASTYQSTRDPGITAVIEDERKRWHRVQGPLQPADVLVMRVYGRPAHVGVVVAANRFLHVLRGTAVCLDYLDSPHWQGRIDDAFRHASRT